MSYLALESYDLIDDKVVHITWSASDDLSNVFKSTTLTIKFDTPVNLNADIAAFTFLNIIVPCYYQSHDSDYEVSFPENITQEILDNSRKYHEFDKVNFINPEETEINSNSIDRTTTTDYAIFYGGGKDSLLSAAIHQDVYGAENVTLLRLVWDVKTGNLDSKRDIISEPLKFMAKRGFKYEYVESNFHSIIFNRDIGKIPNFALYPGLMAPLISRRGFKQLAHGYDAGHFYKHPKVGKKLHFQLVRPEYLKVLSSALSSAVAEPVAFKNFNYGFNAGVAFKLLAKGYPEYLPNIYMCERLAGKWCIKCRKCFFYALACLAYKCPSDFNLGYFFQNSQYVKDLVEEIAEVYKSGSAKIRYVDKLAYRNHVCSTVQVAHDIDLNYARSRLWHQKYPDAFLNLVKIIEPYKNFNFPDYDAFWLRAYEEDARELGTDLNRDELKKLLSSLEKASIPISDKYQIGGINREMPVEHDYRVETNTSEDEDI